MANETVPTPSRRLLSLDALRGFDMFWIMGGDSLAAAFGALSHNAFVKAVTDQLEHVEWAGLRFYDCIFPLFVFIVGVSLTFSIGRTLEQHGRKEALRRIVRRFALMFAMGVFFYGGFANHWPDIRLVGVLHRIALCYLFASLLFCYCSWRALAGIAAGLLLGYWAVMSFLPFPDLRPLDANGQPMAIAAPQVTNTAQLNWATTNTVKGVFEPGFNYAHYIDEKYLPGKKWDKTWDPEGLLSTIPAIAGCLLGVLAGMFLKNHTIDDRRKVTLLLIAGGVSIVAGLGWSAQFPIIKKIWSSSFVLVTGGVSLVLLAGFYYVVDVLHFQKWCQPFVWYGTNAITVYMADNLMSFRRLSQRFLGGDVKDFLDLHVTAGFGELVLSCGEIGLGLALVWFLYRKKLFLRL
jgi:predicted acyltransferase